MNMLILKHCLLAVFLAVFTFFDIKAQKISNKLVLVMLAAGLVMILLQKNVVNTAVMSAFGLMAAAVFMLPIYFMSKGGLGAGDVKLCLCMSVFVGLYDFINIMIYALIYTVVFGVAAMVVKRKNAKTRLPFAPFLFLGCITNILYFLIEQGGN